MWTALAGGVGGAKLARGLMAALGSAASDELHVIVNTGDDFSLYGLHISPDIDTVLYTLAGIANLATGWGIAGDTAAALDQLGKLGAETWFWLGDRDLATHLLRTAALRQGATLSQVTADLAHRLGLPTNVHIVPMTDDQVGTEILAPDGWLAFQEYFVRRRQSDPVLDVRFDGVDSARPSPGALAAVQNASLIVFCPSNPIVSIGPILALPDLRAVLAGRAGQCPRVAVSPIIGGRALKGPADRMLAGLGHEVSALGVARLYVGLIDLFVLDELDGALAPAIVELGMRPLVTKTIMSTPEDSRDLALTIARAVGI